MAQYTSMTKMTNIRPSVPSRLSTLHHDGDEARGQAEAAKNLWVRTVHQWQLTVGTYNVGSLLSDDRLLELDTEIENIQWDNIGISEVRRKATDLAILRNGHLFHHVRNDNSQVGVGFLVHKSSAGNVMEFKGIGDRICFVSWRLNKKCRVNIIQVYSPTSS